MHDIRNSVLIIGGRGEFGQFLQRDILPSLGAEIVLTIERDTPFEQRHDRLRQAQHIILATPLAGYTERACELVEQCRESSTPTTLWLISSVQADVCRAVAGMLAKVTNPYLSAVFVHPMYGPNGWRAKEREADTFRNILTATIEGPHHPVANEVALISDAFRRRLSIGTTMEFDPQTHDRATAYSQGLSYCLARTMFERPEIDAAVRDEMPDLHRSFHANHNLIDEFLKLNTFMPEVISAFTDSWQRTARSTYADVMRAFGETDRMLHHEGSSLIPTKWYEKLRAASIAST